MAADNTPLLRRKALIAAKIETTTGTAISLAAADGVFNAYIDPSNAYDEDIPVDDREAISTMEQLPGVPGPRMARMRFSLDFVGLATGAGVPTWADLFLVACGMAKSSQTYSFVTGPATITTLTIGLWYHTLHHLITGAVGDWTIELQAGRKGMINFEFLGVAQPDADVTRVTPTHVTAAPPRWANTGAVTLGAFTPRVSRATIRAGNELAIREDADATAGFRSGVIVDRKSGFGIDPEAGLVADRAWQSILLTPTEEAASFIVGATSNNIMTVSAPKAQLRSRKDGERNKMLIHQAEYSANRNGTTLDSAMSLAFS